MKRGDAPTHPPGEELPEVLEAGDWMNALGDVLEQLGLGREAASDMVCTLRPNGGFELARAESDSRMVTVVELSPAGGLEELPSVDITPAVAAAGGSIEAGNEAPEPQLAGGTRIIDTGGLERLQALLARLDEPAGTEDEICSTALDLVLQVVPAESACVLLHDPGEAALRFACARGPRSRDLAGQRIPENVGIAGIVRRTGTGLMVREAATRTDHYGEVDRSTGYRTRAILAVPIRRADRVRGVLELLNPFGSTSFSAWHRQAADLVAERLSHRLPA